MRKQQVVQLKSIRGAAKELGLDFSTLARWIRQTPAITVYQIGGSHAVLPSELSLVFAERIARLRKQVA